MKEEKKWRKEEGRKTIKRIKQRKKIRIVKERNTRKNK